LKFAICNEFCQNWSFEDVLRLASDVGYEGVEIAPFTLADSVTRISPVRRLEIRKLADLAKVEIVGLHWLLASPSGLYINHPDESIRNKTCEYFIELIKCCADLGGKVMVIGSPKQRNVYEGLTRRKAWAYAKATFQRCAAFAQEKGVTLCIEPLSRGDTNFINTHDEAIQMIQEVNNPNFRLVLDVKAMCDEDTPIPAIIRDGKSYLAHFHANDENRRGPGFGSTDFLPIMAALRKIGYQGYVSVEVFDFKPDPETIASKSYECLKKACAGLY
jgi:sugar phosphate isomerase/epimerase